MKVRKIIEKKAKIKKYTKNDNRAKQQKPQRRYTQKNQNSTNKRDGRTGKASRKESVGEEKGGKETREANISEKMHCTW